jgi:hypothetical protein
MRNPSVAELAKPRWGPVNPTLYANLGEVELQAYGTLPKCIIR